MGTWTFKIRRRGPLAASAHQDAWTRKSLLSHVVHPFAQPRGDVSMRQMVHIRGHVIAADRYGAYQTPSRSRQILDAHIRRLIRLYDLINKG